MPNPLNNVACGNDYTDAATILDLFGARGGVFVIANNSAYVKTEYGGQGETYWTDELLVPPSSGVFEAGVIGVAFRNATANSVARVIARLTPPVQPNMATTLTEVTQQLSPSGGVTPGGSTALDFLFGDGSDGAVSLTAASAAPAWATKAGTTFNLTRDVYFTTLSLSAGGGAFTLNTAGFRIFATTSLTIDASIVVSNDGAQGGPGRTPAGVGASAGTIGGGGNGGTGGLGSNGAQAPVISNGSALGGSGSKGGSTNGGGGTGGGVNAAQTASLLATNGSPRNLAQATTLTGPTGAAPRFVGGAGGNGGDSSGANIQGGAGAGAGGLVGIYAKLILNSGLISANGGTGADAVLNSPGGTGGGGGGGGGGGAVILVFGSLGSSTGSVTATGGTGGAPVLNGNHGATASDGTVYLIALS